MIMPINKAYPINKLIPVLKDYYKKTNRRLTFEYIMLKDINDSEECAIELANLVKGMNCYINLIPYNETNKKLGDEIKWYKPFKLIERIKELEILTKEQFVIINTYKDELDTAKKMIKSLEEDPLLD